MHLSQDDIAYFGLDQLQIRLPVNKWRIAIPEINHTNTPEAYIECGEYKFRIRLGFTPSQYAKNLVFELQYQTFDEDTFILTNDYLHAFSYMYGATQGSVTTHNKLVIHSTFFAYMTKSGKNHESIYNFLIQIADIDTSSIRRADIAMDIVNIPRQEVISWFDPDCYSAKIGKKKHEKVHQTHYIGQYEVTKNRNYIVRIYDKVADTTKKMKGFLFGHYSQYSHVTRVEIELRALFFEHVGKGEQDSDFQFFSDFTAKDLLLHPKILSSIFAKKLSLYSHIDTTDLLFQPYSRHVFPLKQEYLKAQHIPHTYMSRFLGYSKKILELTGPHGFAQAYFGVMPDKRKKRQVTQYPIDELKLFDSFVRYFFKAFPQHKIKIIQIISNI